MVKVIDIDIDIDFEQLERRTSKDFVGLVKQDIKQLLDSRFQFEKVKIEDSKSHVVVGLYTGATFFLYIFNQRHEMYYKKTISISDYWFIERFLEEAKS